MTCAHPLAGHRSQPACRGGRFPVRHTMVKVCGLTRQHDVSVCAALGVDMAGFIFHPGSLRAVMPEHVARLETGNMVRVGVFVEQDVDGVLRIMREARLDAAQLHGGQDAAFCAALRCGLAALGLSARVLRVLWPLNHMAHLAQGPAQPAADTSSGGMESRMEQGPAQPAADSPEGGYLAQQSLLREAAALAPHVDGFVLDAGTSGGGHGRRLPPEVVAGLALPRPWLLAGGLAPGNVAEALAICRPSGVDFNSGIEDAPGLKNAESIRRALAAVTASDINAGARFRQQGATS